MKRKVMAAGALLLITLTLQAAAEPPMTLPKEFLAQLPLLMSLSDQEFESLLATAQRKNENSEPAKNSGKEKRDDEN